MPKIDLYTSTGKKSGQLDLPKEIFAAPVNEQLMTQAVRVYLSNQRRAGAKTKTRGEIRGSTRKIWRQKGTGRARHGDRYAPIFVGGGRAHGPTGEENYKLRMSKPMKRRALLSALTSKLKDKKVVAVKGLAKIEPKTKEMAKVIDSLKLNKKDKKILLVLPKILKNVLRAAGNITEVELVQANQLNTYQILNCDQIIFMEKSINRLKETFLAEGSK
jgi:large subunit ribosomal protein L4